MRVPLVALVLLSACAPKPAPLPAAVAKPAGEPITLPGAGDGIGFDDLGYSRSLGRVLVPAGRSGKLDLVDPATKEVVAIGGFSSELSFAGGHGAGTTSVDDGLGWLFAIDRTALSLAVVDPKKAQIVSRAPLASGPDYVRFVAPTRELWVTEPDLKRIEVFTLSSAAVPVAKHAAFIDVPGGPESLVIDATRGRAYTHLWKDTTLSIDLKTRAITARWPNGCQGSRGIALDEAHGWIFVGCDEGRAVVLDAAHDGKAISSLASGSGIDVIAFDPARRHLYLPGADSATMAVAGVGETGILTLLGTVDTARGAHCVTIDFLGGVWVCDPAAGRLLRYEDTWPAK